MCKFTAPYSIPHPRGFFHLANFCVHLISPTPRSFSVCSPHPRWDRHPCHLQSLPVAPSLSLRSTGFIPVLERLCSCCSFLQEAHPGAPGKIFLTLL